MQELNTSLLERPSGAAQKREQMIVRSALWAAAGDALGWITELASDSLNVKRRSGTSYIQEPAKWKRVIGGRTGPKVDLPAGTYSDDTQLRLAVSRCIRGDGVFDAEAFAKIELTVWPTYALGGGLGTKAAAVSLSRRSTTWFSNFFESGSQRYIHGGGNGAAMRIQPHVWASKRSAPDLILAVLRDSLITHGHPQGFCGAVFHALALQESIATCSIPSPDMWGSFVDAFLEIPEILERDPQLAAFWRSAWENQSKTTLEQALKEAHNSAVSDLHHLLSAAKFMEPEEYPSALKALGCLTPEFRGAGLKTAMAAMALAFMHRSSSPEAALIQAANELNSDTDTIATMAGSLLGVTAEAEPTWSIQDRDYIVHEAKRLADISAGKPRESFAYPDLARWTPPANQLSAIGWLEEDLAIVGLGLLEPIDKEHQVGESVWQWCRLPFGQTILAKRKTVPEKVSFDQMPGLPVAHVRFAPSPSSAPQQSLGFVENPTRSERPSSRRNAGTAVKEWSLDDATDEAIRADFEASIVGNLLNECIDQTQSIEHAIAFAAILAKAKLARQRKRR